MMIMVWSTLCFTSFRLLQGYIVVPAEKRFLLLFTFLKKNRKKKVMVFFSSCNSVKYHAELLNYIDIPVLDIHVSLLLCCVYHKSWITFKRKVFLWYFFLIFYVHSANLIIKINWQQKEKKSTSIKLTAVCPSVYRACLNLSLSKNSVYYQYNIDLHREWIKKLTFIWVSYYRDVRSNRNVQARSLNFAQPKVGYCCVLMWLLVVLTSLRLIGLFNLTRQMILRYY